MNERYPVYGKNGVCAHDDKDLLYALFQTIALWLHVGTAVVNVLMTDEFEGEPDDDYCPKALETALCSLDESRPLMEPYERDHPAREGAAMNVIIESKDGVCAHARSDFFPEFIERSEFWTYLSTAAVRVGRRTSQGEG